MFDLKVRLPHRIGLTGKGKYKWDKWNEQKGKSQADAEKEYIAVHAHFEDDVDDQFVETLKANYA